MKLKDLLIALQDLNPEAEIVVLNWDAEYDIEGVYAEDEDGPVEIELTKKEAA